MPNQNHEFLEGDVPYTLNPGGPNHEELSCLIGIYEYFNNLYNHHFSDEQTTIRKKIEKINQLISKHEEKIGNLLLEFLRTRNDLRLIGKDIMFEQNRAPTFAFTSKNHSSKIIKQSISEKWNCYKK